MADSAENREMLSVFRTGDCLRKMKAFLACFLGLGAGVLAVTPPAGGDHPELVLREAVDRLCAAGSYSWEEKRDLYRGEAKPGARRAPFASGETEIGGFTVATIQRRVLVFHSDEAAAKLSGGWRHVADLNAEELREFGLYRAGTARSDARARHYTRPFAHEMLRMLLQYGIQFRKEGAAIVGEIDGARVSVTELESYLSTGKPLAETPPARLLGRPVPGTKVPPRTVPRTMGNRENATFTVWLEGSEITELSFEFMRMTVFHNEPGATGVPERTARSYITRVTNIGTTKVDVDPLARALFLKASVLP